jgi:hypothetical protein
MDIAPKTFAKTSKKSWECMRIIQINTQVILKIEND